MKLKKYIKLMEDEPQEEMTEHELELYNSLLERVEKNAAVRTAKQAKMLKIFTPIVSSLVVIVFTIVCVFSLKNSTNEILYKDINVISKIVDYTELQTNIKFFTIENIESESEQIKMSYDSESNDKLYYSVSGYVESSSINFVILINEKYNYNFDLDGEEKSAHLADYTVFYTVENIRDIPAKKKFRGRIKVQTEIVYFEFIQKPALGDEAFFETIQQVVKVKK